MIKPDKDGKTANAARVHRVHRLADASLPRDEMEGGSVSYPGPEQWMEENDDNGDPNPYVPDDEPDCGSCSCVVACEGRP